ncbi:unnamed protein product [Paramecium octaurelia]|uniref:rRNA-processing protein EFG1 n=1 Tax=Paramecium octaurelia TaxID=43137 RepID=A0A8S1WX75_PAROT|nr:unnamed protein product [Paramecium octaurelia]
METHKKIYIRRNELPLNKFHQLKRSKIVQKEGESCNKLKNKSEIYKGQQSKLTRSRSQIETTKLKIEQQKQLQKKIDYFAGKYKKIKQVDLKKLKRQQEKIQKELEIFEKREPLLALESEIQERIIYVKYYSKDQKYISLLGKNLNEHAKEQQELLINESKKFLNKKNLKNKELFRKLLRKLMMNFEG